VSRVEDGVLVSCPKPARVEKAPKRIRAVSPKNRASEAVYDENRALRLQQNPICQRCGMYRASVVHHILPRTPKNSDHSLPNLMSLCDGPGSNGCHKAVHDFPADSYREGWLRRRFPRPGDYWYAELDESGRFDQLTGQKP